jgi:hypothetical protein
LKSWPGDHADITTLLAIYSKEAHLHLDRYRSIVASTGVGSSKLSGSQLALNITCTLMDHHLLPRAAIGRELRARPTARVLAFDVRSAEGDTAFVVFVRQNVAELLP